MVRLALIGLPGQKKVLTWLSNFKRVKGGL
jgi:hypothetical protein